MANLALRGQPSGRLRPGLFFAEATSFVGRMGELRQITALLRSARLVTLVGPGGVGKTRVCQRAALMAATQFPDGAWLIELSGLRDPALVYAAVAAAFKLPDQDAPSQRSAVLHRLRDRRLLLVLDTCEHLIDACAAFTEEVLRSAPGVSVLATSRQPLDAPGEHAFQVLPLRADSDAVDLFAQRAVAVTPGFEVTPGNRDDVIRLCRRLDGIPLAIELAAVRLRALPLPDLADRLESGFGVLTGSRRGTTPRHQTLRTAIEWSHGLCTPAEQRLWARLSVFAGTFDVEAAEEVCAGDDLPREEIIHALVSLVDKSVVLRSGSEKNRYRLLDTLREFGAGQLAASGDQHRALDRLTARYLGMATRFDERFLDEDQAARYHALRREYPNIRAALECTLGDQRPPGSEEELLTRARRGASLTIRLHAFWQISGRLREGRHWLDKVLRLFPAPTEGSGQAPATERIWALGVSGRLATFQGDVKAALAAITESIGAAEETGDELAAAQGYFYLNLALAFAGQHDEALLAGETARQLMTACRHHIGLVCLEPQLAQLHQLAGNVEATIECCDRGLAMLRAGARERWITSCLALIYGLALFQSPGRDADCVNAIGRALAAKHDLGDVTGIACSLEVLGWLAARAGQFERAAWLLGAAEQLWQHTATASRPGDIAIMEKAHDHAAEITREALGVRRYQAAHRQGAGLSLDRAVRMALGGTGGPSHGEAADGAGGKASGGDKRTPAGPARGTGSSRAALTRREREIADLVASGLSNKEIADQLFISKRTVDAHVEHIFSKLEISSRVQLTILLRDQLSA